MGRFFSSVPNHFTGSCVSGAPPMMTVKMMVAARHMDGHMTITVPACRISRQKKGLSLAGSQTLAASLAPSRLPHRLEMTMTSAPMNAASTSALPTTA